MYSEVTGDLFQIAKRLLMINKTYRVFWNNRDSRYEVHSITGNRRPSLLTLGFVVPFECLDVRTLMHARRTRRENADAIETEISVNNDLVTQSARRWVEKTNALLVDMLDYANRTNHPVIFTKNYVKEF